MFSRDSLIDCLSFNADIGILNLPFTDKFIRDFTGFFDRYSKSYSLRNAVCAVDQCVYADYFAFLIYQRAATIPGIDGRVGLDKICICFWAVRFMTDRNITIKRADHTCGYTMLKTKRASDGNGQLSNPKILRRSQTRNGEVGSFYPNDGNVAVRICSYNFSGYLLVIQCDNYAISALYYVGVCQDKSITFYNYARANTLAFALISSRIVHTRV